LCLGSIAVEHSTLKLKIKCSNPATGAGERENCKKSCSLISKLSFKKKYSGFFRKFDGKEKMTFDRLIEFQIHLFQIFGRKKRTEREKEREA
jgi:hypothetical protein